MGTVYNILFKRDIPEFSNYDKYVYKTIIFFGLDNHCLCN